MKDDEISILYQIKGIKPCIKQDGYVEVRMSPIDKLPFDEDENNDLPIKISHARSDGNNLPPHLIQDINKMMKHALPPHLRKQNKDPRDFLHVETEVDFIARGWKYGDTISLTLKKVEEKEPTTLLHKTDQSQ